MVIKQEPFRPVDENLYLEKIKASVIYNMKVKMKRLNLSTNDLIWIESYVLDGIHGLKIKSVKAEEEPKSDAAEPEKTDM